MKRNHQIDSLNTSRSHVRGLEEKWRQLVSGEIQNTDRTIEEEEMRIQVSYHSRSKCYHSRSVLSFKKCVIIQEVSVIIQEVCYHSRSVLSFKK